MKLFENKFNFMQSRRVEKNGIDYSFAKPEHCRDLAELYCLATDGVAEYYWSTVKKADESIIDTGERLFSEDEKFNYKNCLVACHNGRVIGMSLQFHLDVDSQPTADMDTIDPVLRPYKKLEKIDSFHCAALAVLPEYQKHRVGISLITLVYELAVGFGFDKMTHMVFAQKGKSVINFWNKHMGYSVAASEPVVENSYIKANGEILLFLKELNVP